MFTCRTLPPAQARLRTLLGILLFVLGLYMASQGFSGVMKTREFTSALGVDKATLVEIRDAVEELGEGYRKALIEQRFDISVGRLSLKSLPQAALMRWAPLLLAGGLLLMALGLMLRGTGKYVLIYIVLLLFIFPFFWMVLASFRHNVDIIDASRGLFAGELTFKNYVSVFNKYNFLRPTFNSFYVGGMSTLLGLIIGLPAAYAIARWKMYKIGLTILVVRMIPGITFLVPWYMLFLQLGLTNTFTALILSHLLVALPFIIWIMVPFFSAMPRELEEAAWVDGSAQWRTFLTMVLRISLPGILTASLLAFIFSWNNFMFSLTLSGAKTTTLPIAIYGFVSYASVDWGGLMAAAVFITLPIILLSLFMQKYIISGLTAGAVKG